ncbi:protein-tyrosine phosphatase [Streptomyces sp. 2333.5]|uniref:low molecular weight protein-tyrosine-phosphatase n=1 Tax=unclassified Streptomyces TaxID=2593676 RepID=UPI000896833B|nr:MULTISPECIES: low molecular weight protein-tyrosine-phosphatase [unclassified Streptomyces]PJJ03227.1 protein-tyrosine phosphatase [Streptomyces sp. 2333.5]SED52512.1 protein-tyrosine phosphatase [Streptomyces sp. 2314.4]SEE36414.1 protein-tyrosine phosphatase [Streptomyces sp. 2112.2]
MNAPFRICFVCTGNICRSPMAESVFRAHLAEDGLDGLVEVDSAGTGGWHEGDGADPRTVAVLRAGGYARAHTARQFRASWFDRLDLVIALDSGHLRTLRSLAPTEQDAAKVRLLRSYATGAADAGPGEPPGLISDSDRTGDLDVPDPYYGGFAGFEECLEMIETASEGLLAAVRTALTARAVIPARAPGADAPREARDPHRSRPKERA